MVNRKYAIKVREVSKTFQPQSSARTIKEGFVGLGRKFSGKSTLSYHQGEYTAIKDISFEIEKGEFFGIVGRNGSGKSTLLKIMAGVYAPTNGSVHINGTLTPFIELGVGFNPELTGRDNVFLNGALLGFTRQQMEEMYDDIVEFAELKEFMDKKLKNYSSGMQVRLAFSVAIRAKSDVLLIDEVLAVGDALFQEKCFNYFRKLKKDNTTVVFVSHDTGSLKRFCDRGLLIEESKIVKIGKIDDVVGEYLNVLNSGDDQSIDQNNLSEGLKKKRWGSGKVIAERVQLISGDSKKGLFTDDDNITIKVTYVARVNVAKPVYGITINSADGLNVFDTNTLWQSINTKSLRANEKNVVEFVIPNIFNTGDYFISPAVANEDGNEMYDWVDEMTRFKVRKSRTSTAISNVKHTISIKSTNFSNK